MTRNYHNISQGLGKFSPDLFARLMTMLEAYETSGLGQELQNYRQPPRNNLGGFSGKQGVILASINNPVQLTANRWKYQFSRLLPSNFDPDETPDYNLTQVGINPISGPAYNLVEFRNTADFAGPGIDLSAADFPSGMSVQPIEDDTPAIVFVTRDSNGFMVGFFNIANAIDGSCS